jgi:hypothetical protein
VLPALCLALLVQVAGADAPKPEIKSYLPLGLRAGHTTTLQLYGANLTPKSVSAGKPQVGVKLVGAKATEGDAKTRGARQVTLEVTPPRDPALNAVELTLTQPDGGKASVTVPVLEEVAVETTVKKPNGNYAQAMPLPGPSIGVTGTLDGDTPATFRFEAKAGETWDFTLLAGRAGSALDALMRVRDRKHLSLALAAGNPKNDRHIRFRAPADGPYYLEIVDDQGRGGPTFTYLLTAVNRR